MVGSTGSSAAATATPPCSSNSRNNSNGSSNIALATGGSSGVTTDQGSAISPAGGDSALGVATGATLFGSGHLHHHSFDRLPPLCASPLAAYRHHSGASSSATVIGNCSNSGSGMVLAGNVVSSSASMNSSPHSHVALISAVTPGLGFSLPNGSDVPSSLLATVDPEEDPHHSYHHGMHMAPSPHHHHHLYHHHHHHDYHHHAAAAAALLGGFTSGGGAGLIDCVTESNNCADREDSTGFISVAGTSANSAVGNYCLSGGIDSVTGLVGTNDGEEAAGTGATVESGSLNGGGSDSSVLRSNNRSISTSSSSLTVTAARTAAAAAAAVAAVSNHHHHLQQHSTAEIPYHHHHHRPLPMDISAL